MQPILLSSPLQGFTDFRFRNAFQKYFGGIDTFYAPYIRLNGKLVVKPAYERDLLPKNNSTLTVIPQIMTNDADEFLFVADYVKKLGYNELNWNLGCPYPMVTKRCMGSGLISDAKRINEVLKKVHNESDIIVSMKMRMGYEHSAEILDVFPVLDQYPIKNIAIHARIGKQLYKGGVDLESFETCLQHTNHTIYYNGDITTVAKWREMVKRFPSIKHWMIGRGLISDPFLPNMIKNDTEVYPENRFEIFSDFHETLFNEFDEALSGVGHTLLKMYSFWEYFSAAFNDTHKTLKKIKKAKNLNAYHEAVAAFLEKEMEVADRC
ncbi:MAG: tRNA-dihydrouridine synthase B [Flavobacteriales bacterium]|jgi:tRNA-dihydrouridine synthase B